MLLKSWQIEQKEVTGEVNLKFPIISSIIIFAVICTQGNFRIKSYRYKMTLISSFILILHNNSVNISDSREKPEPGNQLLLPLGLDWSAIWAPFSHLFTDRECKMCQCSAWVIALLADGLFLGKPGGWDTGASKPEEGEGEGMQEGTVGL